MKKSCKGQRIKSFGNKYLALISMLLFCFGAKAQITYTPMTAAGYQFKYIKADSGFAVPFINLTTGRGIVRPGVIVCNTADSLLYYFNGVSFVHVGSGTAGTPYTDSVTINGNYLFYWVSGAGHGTQINKIDSINSSNDSVFSYIGGAKTFAFKVTAGTGTVTSITGGYGINGGTITTGGTFIIDTSVIAYKSFIAAHYSALGHTHPASDIISGIFPIARGGTGLSGIGSVGQVLTVAPSGTVLQYSTPVSGADIHDSIAGISPDTSHIINVGTSGIPLLYTNGTDSIFAKKLVAGTNVTLTQNTDSSVTINSSGSGGTGGISKILAGFGQLQKTDSSTNNDTTVMATVARLISDSASLKAAIDLKQNQLNGTGFVKASGTTISYDNSTYLTTVDTTNISNFSVKVRSLFSATSPITYVNGLIGITQSGTSTNGYLSSTDWNTFNNKGLGTITAVTGSGNISSSGGATPNITFTGTLPIANGGTNNSSLPVTAGSIYYGNGTMLVAVAPGTVNQILHGGTTPIWKDTTAISGGGGSTLTFGTGLTGGSYNGLSAVTTKVDTSYGFIWTSANAANPNIFVRDGLGSAVVNTQGLIIQNRTPAISGTQQNSPSLILRGNGWGTTAGTSQNVDWYIQTIAAQGAVPSSTLAFYNSINNATPVQVMSINTSSGGILGAAIGSFGTAVSAGSTCSSGQLIGGVATFSGQSYRTTNAGGGASPWIVASNAVMTAGTLGMSYEGTNQLTFHAANGTLKIARASIGITNLTNTAGSESGDLYFSTQSGGTAIAEKMRLTSTGSLGIGVTSPAATAILDATSTTQGFLPPRMTTTQKNAISSPAEGLIVYDLTLHKLCVYTGSAWETITSI